MVLRREISASVATQTLPGSHSWMAVVLEMQLRAALSRLL